MDEYMIQEDNINIKGKPGKAFFEDNIKVVLKEIGDNVISQLRSEITGEQHYRRREDNIKMNLKKIDVDLMS